MAGRLILWNNTVDQITGTCEAEGYEDLLELQSLSFAATAYAHQDSSSGTAHQSSFAITLAHGDWVADFQQRLFHGKTLGTVTLTEIEQKVDAGKKTWKKIREITLTEAWMESMSHSWAGIHSSVSFSVEYTDMTFAHSDKIAHYNRSEK